MNVTVSIDDKVAERARERLAEMGETIEQALEDYIRTLANSPKRSELLPKHRTLREQTYRIG
jgi:antitoxin component of RelBE/YafQ-DinJ toxin-antitoxin module